MIIKDTDIIKLALIIKFLSLDVLLDLSISPDYFILILIPLFWKKQMYIFRETKTIILFFILLFLSSFWSLYQTQSLFYSIRFFPLIFIVITLKNLNENDLELFLRSIHKIIIAYVYISFVTVYFRELDNGRYSLLGSNSNYSIPILGFSLLYTWKSFYNKTTYINILNFIILSLSVIFTLSRMGSLSIILAVIFMSLAMRKRGEIFFNRVAFPSKIIIKFISIILLISVLAFRVGANLTDRYSGTENDARFVIWTVLISKIYEEPLYGNGAGTSKLYLEDAISLDGKIEGLKGARMAHNTYLEILFGTGLIGLLIFLKVLQNNLYKYLKSKWANLDPLRIFLTSIGIYLILHSFTSNFETNRVLWFFIGASISLKNKNK